MPTTADVEILASGRLRYRGESFNGYNTPKRTPKKAKKSAVLARRGNQIKLVRFGDPNMAIKVTSKKHRERFRARHRCATAQDIFTPRYWSCKAWELKGSKMAVKKRRRVVKKKRHNSNNKRTPAQIRATKRLVALNRKRARANRAQTPSNRRRATRTNTRRANPIRYVIQAINVNTGATGWFTGDSIDDDIKKARTYKNARGAAIVAKQLFQVLPNTWRLLVLHEHRPR